MHCCAHVAAGAVALGLPQAPLLFSATQPARPPTTLPCARTWAATARTAAASPGVMSTWRNTMRWLAGLVGMPSRKQ